MKKLVLVILLFCCSISLSANEDLLREWDDFSKSADAAVLKSWLMSTSLDLLKGEKRIKKMKISTPQFAGSLGLFITIIKDNRVLGCYGAFSHGSDRLDYVLMEYCRGALFYDPRHKTPEIEDLENARIVLTVATQAFGVSDLGGVNPAENGICITYNSGETFIYVPAEIRNMDSLIYNLNRKSKDYSAALFRAVTIK